MDESLFPAKLAEARGKVASLTQELDELSVAHGVLKAHYKEKNYKLSEENKLLKILLLPKKTLNFYFFKVDIFWPLFRFSKAK